MKIKFSDADTFLIWLYSTIDDMNAQTELKIYTERFSNNCNPYFKDTELFSCAVFTEMLGYHCKKTVMIILNVITKLGSFYFPNMKFIPENLTSFKKPYHTF